MRRALVTGGTRGIGLAIAESLYEAGYTIYVSGKSKRVQVSAKFSYLGYDMADAQEVEAFALKVTDLNLDILINNAGINKVGPLADYNLKDYSRIQQVNVTAAYRLCQAVIPFMVQQKFGRIVNITSIFGVVSKAGRSAYTTSKFALFGLTRSLALEVASHNVLVNCIAPGFVDTDLTRQVLGHEGIARIITQVPIGRLAQPSEIAAYVKFLVSEENSYLTGQNIVVDGGFTSA